LSEQRTVLVESISYRGTDGEDHVAHRGDKITVAKEGVDHFDWIHDATPEARHAAALKAAEEAEKSARASKAAPAAKKADESA
jgi:hypothetical protein